MRLGGFSTFVDFARVVAVPAVGRRRVAAGLVSTLAITLAPLVPSAAEPPPEGTPVTAAAMVKDFDAMGGSLIDMVDVDGRAFFVGRTAEHGEELWTSDGTTEGTRLVEDIWAGPANYHAYPVTGVGVLGLDDGRSTVIDDILYFVAADGVHGGTLWRSDGTAAGTRMVKDVVPDSTQGNEVCSMGAAGGTLFLLVSVGHRPPALEVRRHLGRHRQGRRCRQRQHGQHRRTRERGRLRCRQPVQRRAVAQRRDGCGHGPAGWAHDRPAAHGRGGPRVLHRGRGRLRAPVADGRYPWTAPRGSPATHGPATSSTFSPVSPTSTASSSTWSTTSPTRRARTSSCGAWAPPAPAPS